MARSLIPAAPRRGIDLAASPVVRGAARARETDLKPVFESPLLQARSVGEVELDATAREFAHGLGRVPAGWLLVDPDVGTLVWRVAKSTETLTLSALVSVRGTLWVW
jgi:hypothetical protein